jgi:hypothetical protein
MLEDSLVELGERAQLGERAKLGILKTSMGLLWCGILRPGLCARTSFLSELGGLDAVGVVGVLAPLTLTPL